MLLQHPQRTACFIAMQLLTVNNMEDLSQEDLKILWFKVESLEALLSTLIDSFQGSTESGQAIQETTKAWSDYQQSLKH